MHANTQTEIILHGLDSSSVKLSQDTINKFQLFAQIAAALTRPMSRLQLQREQGHTSACNISTVHGIEQTIRTVRNNQHLIAVGAEKSGDIERQTLCSVKAGKLLITAPRSAEVQSGGTQTLAAPGGACPGRGDIQYRLCTSSKHARSTYSSKRTPSSHDICRCGDCSLMARSTSTLCCVSPASSWSPRTWQSRNKNQSKSFL